MKDKKVLIVDDDFSVRKLLRIFLEMDGVGIIIEGSNGLHALEKANVEKPDLILLDIMMPQMDGLEALRQLKADPITEKIPVIMLTGRGDQTTLEQVKKAGACLRLIKPFLPGNLSESIKEVFGTK